MKFFKEKKKYDPYEESILRTFSKLNKKVTPSEVAEYMGSHPNTIKKRIRKLEKEGLLVCVPEGKKLYCSKKKEIKI